MNKVEFLSPRMVGKRFDEHSIPLEFLRDFAALEEMIVEVAKWVYRQEHSDRTRLLRGFTKEVSLHLGGVGEGSAIAQIVMLSTAVGLFPTETQHCYQQARDKVVSAIAAAETGNDISKHLPEEFLGYFERIGRSLRDKEAIEFAPNDDQKATLTKETRRKLILSCGKVNEITEDVVLRGSIPEADQDRCSFHLQLMDNTRVRATITDQFRAVILEAFNGYQSGLKVMLQGSGSFNRSNKLTGIKTIDQLVALESNDVATRIEELRVLTNGWLDGAGVALSSDGLDWFSLSFDENYPTDMLLPYLYPTPEGNLLAEWSIGDNSCSLEVDLTTRQAEYHNLNLKTHEDSAQALNLAEQNGWQSLVQLLRDLQPLESKVTEAKHRSRSILLDIPPTGEVVILPTSEAGERTLP